MTSLGEHLSAVDTLWGKLKAAEERVNLARREIDRALDELDHAQDAVRAVQGEIEAEQYRLAASVVSAWRTTSGGRNP